MADRSHGWIVGLTGVLGGVCAAVLRLLHGPELMNAESLSLTTDPVWPWSHAGVGLPAFAAVALILVGLTVWTYRGVRGASRRRVLGLIALRLGALAVACFLVLRPSLASREELNVPSTLVVALDASESMTVQDQFDNQARWDYLRRLVRECEPYFQRLRDEQNVQVVFSRFAGEVSEYDPEGRADGKRTDVGQMLLSLFERHGHDRFLRGLLVLSDGADNGTRHPALTQAARWRSLPCPIHTFAFGQTTTTARQRDIALTNLTPEPSPVAVKGKLTVKVFADAAGFENAAVRVRLFLDDQEIVGRDERLTKTTGNEIRIPCDAPATPGEVKVTVKIDPLAGEMSVVNNEISSYLTVTKEGLSVLYVEGKYRAWEPKFIRYALAQDPRIRLYEAVRLSDDPPPPGEADLFQFDKQHYDVIILGDISARRLAAGNQGNLARLNELVREKGVGLLMIGGYESFANSDWDRSDVAKLLPVQFDVRGQVEERVQMVPTLEGLRHYVLRLTERENDNALVWGKLAKLDGMTRLGMPKPGAVILARTPNGQPILVGQTYGQGRTMAFAGDTTWRWRRSPEGVAAHARFWKQMVLWLAKQDEAEGSIWVKPDTRRLPAGGKLAFSVGARGKGGVDLKDAQYDVKVVGPEKAESTVATAREQDEERGTFWKTDAPGEYRLIVRGRGKDTDGGEVTGEATARFLVYQDDAELARQAADHDFLSRLANAGGGKAYRSEELPQFLQDLRNLPLAQQKPRARLWPDWRRTPPSRTLGDQVNALAASGILACFVLFVLLLSLEWFFRRRWGLV